MTTRVLPPDQWSRLIGTEAETVWPHLKPEHASVMVVEDDGRIVGCWIAMRVMHAECLWIAPDYRGRFDVMRRLWGGMREQVRAWGADVFLTATIAENVRALITRFGGRPVPGDVYALPAKAGRDRLCQL